MAERDGVAQQQDGATGQAPGHQGRQRLRPGEIIAAAARAGRRGWAQVLAIALPVSLVGAALEILVHHYAGPPDEPASIAAMLGVTGISLLGTVLLSAFLCRLVAATEHGQDHLTVLKVARTLPWRRLVIADLLVAVIIVTGLVLLVLPGLAALTYLAVVGPVIEVERVGVRAALRRSVHLVRGHLRAVVLLATLPSAAVAELEAVAPEPVRASEIAQFLVIRGIAEGIAEACVGLVLVELYFRLQHADSAAAAEATDRRS